MVPAASRRDATGNSCSTFGRPHHAGRADAGSNSGVASDGVDGHHSDAGATSEDSAFLTATATRGPAIVQVITPKALVWPTPSSATAYPGARARFAARITFGEGARLDDSTGVVATPRFTQPLSAWL